MTVTYFPRVLVICPPSMSIFHGEQLQRSTKKRMEHASKDLAALAELLDLV